MDAYIKKIYDMLYSPIISPYNLLENAKLENYSYVKYYTNEIGLVAEMQCLIPGEGERVFYYQFDKKDYLQIIYQKTLDEMEIIFSREEAVESSKREYYSSKPDIGKVC
ncbi:hypothetical protein HGO97_012275 [Faecalicatena sp. AGMB00832]|uniref:Uncharacterized protein n=1 Tax=Faecalicatena faecalis TaxID=2726362 RepID=A0ABS6D4S1_9FIRM|nr:MULTISPECIES: hypothetical protein [Faecalicatena]MBU3876579.1 hypothetical protein [Faecalicatena faecalis]MCI6464621.1 hypothetical protein [Faecalicatena sp.]MDY5618198.1 hypothetical protein [Lachnospiraceae bacterium]